MEQKLRRDRAIGDNLRALRDRHGYSQEKLCALLQLRGCDIARSCYAKYEAGELNVRIGVLIELKRSTDVPMMRSLRDWIPTRRTHEDTRLRLASWAGIILVIRSYRLIVIFVA